MAQINIMALRHSAFYSPLLMTIAGGYLRNEGLDPHYALATTGKTVPDSIASGHCHLAQSAVATGFARLEAGHANDAPNDIVHFAQINERDGFFIAGRKPEPGFDWKNLQGKKVLVDHFFQPLAMLRYGLHQHGVAFDSLEVIDAGDVDAMDRAFRGGEGDYIHQQGPAPQQLAKEGIGHVVAAVGDAVGPVAFSSLCASRAWLKTDMAKAFMSAYKKSLVFSIEAPASDIAALEIEAGFFPDIDPRVLTETIATYQSLGCWTRDPAIRTETYTTLLDVFLLSGLISQSHPLESLVVLPPVV